jgi:hypothetical protein
MHYEVRVFPPTPNHQSKEEFFKGYLKKDEGMGKERFEAFDVPSLVNGKRIPATKVRSDLVTLPKFISDVDAFQR